MVILLLVLAVCAWLAGLVTLSNATVGVGGIATACFFAILARMAQADDQHRKLLAATMAHSATVR